jgi:hypothetical protein
MTPQLSTFLTTWQASAGAESANAQSFTNDLCDLLGVPRPEPTQPVEIDNGYVFEKGVQDPKAGIKKIDVYKRGCFILENKQGTTDATSSTPSLSALHQRQRQNTKKGHGKRGTKSYLVAMEKAKNQAVNYARLLPAEEINNGGRPPFVLVCDVGHSISVYADWSRAGGHYQPFPDPNNFRIKLEDLAQEDVRERLHLIWTDPLSLDPARRSARVTKEVADRLAALAKSLEAASGREKTDAEREALATFLMRCLFTMFAEDVELLEDHAFTNLLDSCTQDPESFPFMVGELWAKMDSGGFSTSLRTKIRRFNGGLFAGAGDGIPTLNADQIQLLKEAADADWKEVEPAIFGTLLERALDPRERHKLGAHYTPRAYVERLVEPTILQPLRKEWADVRTAAYIEVEAGNDAAAIQTVETFLQRLADLRVLDPACGSANFLYVTLELLKRLEGEVRGTLRDLGQGQISIGITGATITPENMLGIELNPRAAKIAELVLWIGYLQWHLRSTGGLSDLGDPVLRDYHNIENRDAVLEWDHAEDVLGKDGKPVTRWDGQTYKIHSVTGEKVPDETARTQVQRLIGAKPTSWPKADFIVGNPPFIGTSRMREALGDGYTEAVRKTYKNVPASADFVMFWWDKAAEAVRSEDTERFGFITTNSIRQTFNRRVIQHHMNQKKPISLVFAVPDHPWVDAADGAAVRIAMIVGIGGEATGLQLKIIDEAEFEQNNQGTESFNIRRGKVQADLAVGANVAGTINLLANSELSNKGVLLIGNGFILDRESAIAFSHGDSPYIKEYRNGRDISQVLRDYLVIDLFGLSLEEAKSKAPNLYQHLLVNVKPVREQNNRKSRRDNWWLFGEPNPKLRKQLSGLSRYIVTIETSKHRFFTFLDKSILPDNKLINIALEDAYFLGVLSCRIHVLYSLAVGSWLGVGNDSVYVKTRCFETFPFPTPTESQKSRIRNLAEQLDAHRKRQQSQHDKLTMTGMYNVLEKLRAEESLNDKEKVIYDQGLVGILRELHDKLDAAVAEAYGWPADLGEQEILQLLVDLNAERTAEEAGGLVRWLRPEYQAPDEVADTGTQGELALASDEGPAVIVAEQRKWPKALPEQVGMVRKILAEADRTDLMAADFAPFFKPKLSKKRIGEVDGILEMLSGLGVL